MRKIFGIILLLCVVISLFNFALRGGEAITFTEGYNFVLDTLTVFGEFLAAAKEAAMKSLTWANDLFDKIQEAITSAFDGIKSVFEGIKNAIQDVVTNIETAIRNAFSGLTNAFESVSNWVENVWRAITHFFDKMWPFGQTGEEGHSAGTRR